MMSGVYRVVTQRRGLDHPLTLRFRARIVQALPRWSGYKLVAQSTKLRTHTTILTDPSHQPSPSRASVMIDGRKARLLTDDEVGQAIASGNSIAYNDDPAKDWQWMTDKD